MIKFYFHPTPNPMKIALLLEETGLEFEVVPIDTLKGEQHTEAFLKVNPNGKLPAIEDDGKRVFDSTAILMYLAEKTGKLLPKEEDKAEFLSWMMLLASGLGPFSGQSVHFHHMAPEDIPYAKNRYMSEAERYYSILDKHLEGREFMIGDSYTICDISAWGWIDRVKMVLGEGRLSEFPNLEKWFNGINARPAVERARQVGKGHEFKSVRDEEAQRALFPANFKNK